MDLYVVSFGPKTNRAEASFWSYKNAIKFFNECVADGKHAVHFDVYKQDVMEDFKSEE